MIEHPVTPGVRILREKKIPFVPFLYAYEDHGGTTHAARSLNVDEHAVIKTLVMQGEARSFFLVLMHGDREVSTRNLAREIGLKHVTPAEPDAAQRVTGYQVGGISPFGTRSALPVCVEHTILSLPRIYLNGGKRGFLVQVAPDDLRRAFPITEVHVAIVDTKG
jgi:Cys-tRNA(Pro) deacylase